MSRPDAHFHDYERPPFDCRVFGDNISSGMREYGPAPRDLNAREYPYDTPRDQASRDILSSSCYPSLPTFPSDRRPQSIHPGSGYASFVAPRMFNSQQVIGADNWNPKTGSYTPNPNKHTSDGNNSVASQVQPPLSFAHNHSPPVPSPPHGPSVAELYNSSHIPSALPLSERDGRQSRDIFLGQRQVQHQQQPNTPTVQIPSAHHQSLSSPTSATSTSRSTLWWGELEPWMDEEYAKQVCNLMGWDPVSIKVPRPAPDPLTGQQANNPGYCFLTFPSQAHAASVISQVTNNAGGGPVIMPNSNKPFSLNWASSVPTAPLAPTTTSQAMSLPNGQNPQYPKEYSIFVGDLAPEVSNSDLVAVFRNPVLGLRNDREPRFIRPFLSCKSAKIMLDPVTGVSRGYGFVRFTDEADQQRALIEMHGLYCLSRPMRISPATAKFKPVQGVAGLDLQQMQLPIGHPSAPTVPDHQNQVTIAIPLPGAPQAKSVSAPLAGSLPNTNGNTVSNSTSNSSLSAPSLSSGSSSASSSSTLASATSDDLKASQFSGGNTPTAAMSSASAPSVSAPYAQTPQEQTMAQRFNIPEESWKHHAQARAILSNLIGPNGEQLTSSDPYNTTVFVGGLSPLISEDTLRTFFAPFGEIHYVKVPVGKHCGFVQFVRKPDAERAIEKMQGFPIGGSRIRLSWGRSQYKAAQAAAQAAQAAAFQAQYQAQLAAQNTTTLSPEQALQLLEKIGLANVLNGSNGEAVPTSNVDTDPSARMMQDINGDRTALRHAFDGNPSIFGLRQMNNAASTSAFSPFSPDPNYLAESVKNQDPTAQGQTLPHLSKNYTPWYDSAQEERLASGKVSPTSMQAIRPPSASQRYGNLLGDANQPTSSFSMSRASSRQEGLIVRPDMTRRTSQHPEQYVVQDHDHDILHDVNGTLASLDLNNSPGMWKDGDAARLQHSSP